MLSHHDFDEEDLAEPAMLLSFLNEGFVVFIFLLAPLLGDNIFGVSSCTD